ncbi:hypothetical protein BHE74_00002048, partial [Ensete ventricosum]
IPGIDPNISQHHINNSLKEWLVKQKPRKFTLNYQQAISNEMDKLLGARFIVKV